LVIVKTVQPIFVKFLKVATNSLKNSAFRRLNQHIQIISLYWVNDPKINSKVFWLMAQLARLILRDTMILKMWRIKQLIVVIKATPQN
jgi:hypothetical protein